MTVGDKVVNIRRCTIGNRRIACRWFSQTGPSSFSGTRGTSRRPFSAVRPPPLRRGPLRGWGSPAGLGASQWQRWQAHGAASAAGTADADRYHYLVMVGHSCQRTADDPRWPAPTHTTSPHRYGSIRHSSQSGWASGRCCGAHRHRRPSSRRSPTAPTCEWCMQRRTLDGSALKINVSRFRVKWDKSLPLSCFDVAVSSQVTRSTESLQEFLARRVGVNSAKKVASQPA